MQISSALLRMEYLHFRRMLTLALTGQLGRACNADRDTMAAGVRAVRLYPFPRLARVVDPSTSVQ